MDWDKLRVFHAVAEAGNLTHAGETLHISQSAVSRQIRGLEESLSARLFHRHPRGLLLTSEGELLFEATRDITASLNTTATRIKENREGVYGALRVTAPVDFCALWLTPRLPALLDAHPGLSIDLHATERVLDLPMREADVAIRMRAPTQADVIAKPLGSSTVRLYASDAYLAEHGEPKTAEDLANHRLAAYNPKLPQPDPELDWLFRDGRNGARARPAIIVNSQFALLQTVRTGVAIAVLPDYLGTSEPILKLVLPDLVGPEIILHIVFAQESRQSKRVAVFKRFIEQQLGKTGMEIQQVC